MPNQCSSSYILGCVDDVDVVVTVFDAAQHRLPKFNAKTNEEISTKVNMKEREKK